MKDKKSLYLFAIGTGLVATISLAVFYSNNSLLFSSYAGGVVHTSDKGRTLILDSTTPLVVDGEGKGRVTLGNMAAFSPNCSALSGGIATIYNYGIAIYCPTAAKNGDYYRGFASSTVTNVSITFNGSTADRTVYVCWGRTNGTSISGYGLTVSATMDVKANTPNQTFTYNNNDDTVLKDQNTPKEAANKNSCLYIYVNGYDKPVDLVSLTVQYTCK